jgi:hypothetical protein
VLRIQHINAQPRDARFEKEMQMQKQYRTQGLLSGGPLSMPKSKHVEEVKSASAAPAASSPSALPNSLPGEGSERQVSASSAKKEIVSASGVTLAVNSRPLSSPSPSPHPVNTQAVSEEKASGDDNKTHNRIPSHDAIVSPKKPGNEASDRTANAMPQHYLASRDANSANASLALHNGVLDKDRFKSPRPSTMLFFIHGVGGSSDIWHAQIKHFARLGYEIVAPDLIGHGMSCAPRNSGAYHFKEIVADLEEIFDRYCKKRNIIIGHSYG